MFDRHPALDRKVIVNLDSGNAIGGICTRIRPTFLLRAAVLYEPGMKEGTSLDGEVSVDPISVAFIQLLD